MKFNKFYKKFKLDIKYFKIFYQNKYNFLFLPISLDFYFIVQFLTKRTNSIIIKITDYF